MIELTQGWAFTLQSELYVAGKTLEGETYSAERYMVIATQKDGQRKALRERFPGCQLVEDREMSQILFRDVRDKAKAAAKERLEKVEVKPIFDPEDEWLEIDPAYGSPFYEQLISNIVGGEK